MVTPARFVLSLAAALALTGHPATRIPAGVGRIDVRSPSAVVRVTQRSKVTRIARWFDRLPPVEPGRFACPMLVAGPKITLIFRGVGGILARASYAADTVDRSLISGPCTPIVLAVRGRQKKALVGGRVLLRVQRLLGTKLLG